jgi:hypothetical protein
MRRQVAKPHFAPFEVWGACSRCGTRFAYASLRRERLTGLLLCTDESWPNPRPRGCWDPWPEILSFQAAADRSIEPPREPLPLRTGLDDVFSAAPGIVPAPPDGARFNQVATTNYQLTTPTGIAMQQFPNAYIRPDASRVQSIQSTDFIPAEYDGVFVPTQSERVDLPPEPTPPTEEQLQEEYPPLNLPQDMIVKKV